MLDKSLDELKHSNEKILTLEKKIKEYSELLIKSKEEELKLEKQVSEGERYREES